MNGGSSVGELIRCRCGSCANVSALRCSCSRRVSIQVHQGMSSFMMSCPHPPKSNSNHRQELQNRLRSVAFRLRLSIAQFTLFVLPIWGRMCDLPNGVACAETNPLGDRAVLLLCLRKLLLGAESLVALYNISGQPSIHASIAGWTGRLGHGKGFQCRGRAGNEAYRHFGDVESVTLLIFGDQALPRCYKIAMIPALKVGRALPNWR